MGTFVAAVLGLCGVVSLYYPDKKTVPKSYEGGLDAELGGPRAVRVSVPFYAMDELLIASGASTWRGRLLEALNVECHCTYIHDLDRSTRQPLFFCTTRPDIIINCFCDTTLQIPTPITFPYSTHLLSSSTSAIQ
jgi:hypothetical protein